MPLCTQYYLSCTQIRQIMMFRICLLFYRNAARKQRKTQRDNDSKKKPEFLQTSTNLNCESNYDKVFAKSISQYLGKGQNSSATIYSALSQDAHSFSAANTASIASFFILVTSSFP